jgi:hypothetical protein
LKPTHHPSPERGLPLYAFLTDNGVKRMTINNLHHQTLPVIVTCCALKTCFGIAKGQLFQVQEDATPELGDIVAAEIDGFALLAQFEGDYIQLENESKHYNFRLIGVVEDS